MRSRFVLLVLSLYLAFAVLGCSSKPPADNGTDSSSTTNPSDTAPTSSNATPEKAPRREVREEKKPIVVPAGTSVTVSLGSALGSKISQPGSTFNGSVAKDVLAGNDVAIPKGAAIAGTVTDAKPLGKFAGGAVLAVRLDSITLNGADLPVQASARTFSAKGKGKRTAVMAGGGAALGGIIGALAGGGKGAAIGMAAGAGAGGGGAAFTGNKDIVLPAESAVSFELSQPLEIKR
jgi:hypothetical protein